MTRFLLALAVASALGLPQAPRPELPLGWSETMKKGFDLTLAGKDAEVVALYEAWVAKHPTFAEGTSCRLSA
jgi:hypothetical protein